MVAQILFRHFRRQVANVDSIDMDIGVSKFVVAMIPAIVTRLPHTLLNTRKLHSAVQDYLCLKTTPLLGCNPQVQLFVDFQLNFREASMLVI